MKRIFTLSLILRLTVRGVARGEYGDKPPSEIVKQLLHVNEINNVQVVNKNGLIKPKFSLRLYQY